MDCIPYGRQEITEADIKAVVEVLRSPFITQGPLVDSFEKAVSKKVGAKHGVAFNSATSALHIACLALGLGKESLLWTSPITFVASANCGRYCGAEVDFVDIDPDTGLMSVIALEKKLEVAARIGKLPSVVVPVHLTGASCDMEKVHALASEFRFAVIEDASHAIGGFYKGHSVGSCNYSNITVFSFHPVKIITAGEGGLATTNDSKLACRMADLRSHGIIKDQSKFERMSAGSWAYEQHELGFNYRLSDIHAALGFSQLQRLESIVEERNRLFNFYHDQLSGLPLQLLNIPSDVYSALHLAVIRLDNSEPSHHRRIFDGLRAAGIGVQVHYTPVHLQPYYRKLGFAEGDFFEAEAYATNSISLPIYVGLTEMDQRKVVTSLKDLLTP